jgi:nucleoside 2-deoxyribosyltransferase
MSNYELEPKIIPALRRLRREYDKKDMHDLRDIIDNSHIYVEYGIESDNWNGGTYGHDVILFVPDEMIGLVDLDGQDEIFNRICSDLNKATSEVRNEHICAVFIKLADQSDPQCKTAIPFTDRLVVRPDDVGLWEGNALRLFISHRDEHKTVVHELADELLPFGISSFVAHDAIKPMKEWQYEIHNALETMEVMLAFLTNDFHESDWTNQEVGFALGKGIPIICLKVGDKDPSGFLSAKQALKGNYNEIENSAPEIQKTLMNEVKQAERVKDILIESFLSATDFMDAINGLKRLKKTAEQLTESQFLKITAGYSQNNQLYGCAGIHTNNNSLKNYLESATGKVLKFTNRKIFVIPVDEDDVMPI